MKTAEEIISAFNAICDTLDGRRLAVKIQTLLLQSPRGLDLINRFLEYEIEFSNIQEPTSMDIEKSELYDFAMQGVFECIINELNCYVGEIGKAERIDLFCYLCKIK